MIQPLKPSEAVRKAVAEHAAMSEFVRNLDATVAIWRAKEPGEKIAAIRAFLRKHVVEHFALEDQHIFPGVLESGADAAIAHVVSGLQTDHKQILEEVARLDELLAQVERDGDAHLMAKLDMAFRALLGQLQRHAADEDKLFTTLTARWK
ncbi:MAG: hemerythrin domain-containing protein [Verrucomicrobiae bacterium]|nr:hemerythrin domain-containing protein [Verrucomicrobiae bacterium]